MDEAERCSRVGLIYQGRIVVCDTPEQIKGLVTGELLEIRTSDLRQAEKVVRLLDGVLEVQTYGDLIHAFVDSAQVREAAIRASLAEAGICVTNVRSIRPRMEEAFISLVKRQSTGQTNGQR